MMPTGTSGAVVVNLTAPVLIRREFVLIFLKAVGIIGAITAGLSRLE
jgi:hypothetical protein